jgi:hypothetical protein
MDVRRKTCDIRTWEKHLFLDISSSRSVALPVRRNPQHRSLLTVVISQFRTSVLTSLSSAKGLIRFSVQFLTALRGSFHRKHETFLYESPMH